MMDFAKFSAPVTHKRPAKKEYPPLDWSLVDVPAQMEHHTSTRLRKEGNTQLVGACPFNDCSGDDDGFIVWPGKSKYGQHFLCRNCQRTGDLISLLCEIHGWSFTETLVNIGLRDVDTSLAKRDMSRWETKEQARNKWFFEQLDQLTSYYAKMQKALVAFDRPRQYLESRGISLEDAIHYGLGYFPLPEESGHKIDNEHLKGWFGRIIFPLSSPNKSMTFAGRTLRLWEPGMTPADHKQALANYNMSHPQSKILRVRKTSPCGYFGYAEAIKHHHIVTPEGEFDALSLMVSGIEGVVAMGTTLPVRLIPLHVERVTLPFDADAPGHEAARRLALDLAGRGIEADTLCPPIGNDWNDTYVAGGPEAIQEAFMSRDDDLHCKVCGAEVEYYSPDGVPYCSKHWQAA